MIRMIFERGADVPLFFGFASRRRPLDRRRFPQTEH